MHTRRRSLAATLVLTLSACTPVESTVGSTAVTTSDAVTGPTDTGPSGSATEPTATPSPAPVTSGPVTSSPVTSAPEPPTTPVAPSDWPLALDLLSRVVVANEHRGGYVRDAFGYPAALGNSCDTRAAVLRRDSLTPAQVDPYGCTVVAGDWLSPYDGLRFDLPSELEIDHVVALKEAWDSGAWQWTSAALVAFGNDLTDGRALRAVSTDTNRDKGDKDPSNWLPPDASDLCPFIGDWVAIKVRWQLTMDQSEFGRIRNLLRDQCAGWRVQPTPALPGAAGTSTGPQGIVGPIGPTTPATSPPGAVAPQPDVYYANCTAARAAGAAPILVGQPGYRPALDRDHDGIACE